MATMRKNRSTPSKKAKQAKPKVPRRAIDEALLMVRLGLNEDWIEVWEENGDWRSESCAPSEVPSFVRSRIEFEVTHGESMSTAYAKKQADHEVNERMTDFNAAIILLLESGCQKCVLYYCLEELSPNAEERRSGGELMASYGRLKQTDPDDGQDMPADMVRRKLATREDMEQVSRAAKKALHFIHYYQREILIAADAVEIAKSNRMSGEAVEEKRRESGGDMTADEITLELPRRLTTDLDDPFEAVLLLEDSLRWISKLTEAYSATSEEGLFKSKGLLFLTAYVELVIKAYKPSKSVCARMRRALADVANAAVGTPDNQWSSSRLLDKLHSFEQAHPWAVSRLEHNLEKLHDFHADLSLHQIRHLQSSHLK